MTPDSTFKISRDFSRAASTYDAYASLQRKVADRLFNMFKPEPGLILDIGCGTGYFHELLRKNKIYQPLVQLDIAAQMCEIAQNYASPPEYGGTYTCNADMHSLPFQDNIFNNIFSSMTIQWSHNRNLVFSEIKRTLKEKGNFALAIVANNSLSELAEVFIDAGHAPPIHKFASQEEINIEIKNSGLLIKTISTETTTMQFDNFADIVKSIKNIGGSYKNSGGGIKGKNYFKSLEQIYRNKFEFENKLPLSWNITYITGSNG